MYLLLHNQTHKAAKTRLFKYQFCPVLYPLQQQFKEQDLHTLYLFTKSPSFPGWCRTLGRFQSTPPVNDHAKTTGEVANASPSLSELDSSPSPTPRSASVEQKCSTHRYTVASHANLFSSQNIQYDRAVKKIQLRKLRFNPSVTLQNHGSTARDQLAAERTVLAYIRTSLAIAATGVTLVQVLTLSDAKLQTHGSPLQTRNRQLGRSAKSLGLSSVALALAILGVGKGR